MIRVAHTTACASASPERFFARWCDLATHPEWSSSMEFLRLDEPFAIGARGVLKAKGGNPAPFMITAVEAGRIYADTTSLDGADLTVRHEAHPHDEGTRIVLLASLEGPRERELALQFGQDVQHSLETDLAALVRLLDGDA